MAYRHAGIAAKKSSCKRFTQMQVTWHFPHCPPCSQCKSTQHIDELEITLSLPSRNLKKLDRSRFYTLWVCISGRWKLFAGQYSRKPRKASLYLDHSWAQKLKKKKWMKVESLTLTTHFIFTIKTTLAMTLTFGLFDLIKSTDAFSCLLIVCVHRDLMHDPVHCN